MTCSFLSSNFAIMLFCFLLVDVVRTLLPSVIPPTYRGATIRYLYYIRTTLSGQYLVFENGTSRGESRQGIPELVSFSLSQIFMLVTVLVASINTVIYSFKFLLMFTLPLCVQCSYVTRC